MRLSTDKNDAGFDEAMRRGINIHYVNIYLDGQQQLEARAADDDVGLVIRLLKTTDGKVTFRDGDLVTEIAYGKVEIKLSHREDGTWPHPGVPAP